MGIDDTYKNGRVSKMGSSQISNPPPSVAGRDGGKNPALGAEEHERYRQIADRNIDLNLVDVVKIPAREGRAILVPEESVLRVLCHEGPQVGDMIVFNSNNAKEKFWAARTRVIHRAHLSIGDQLWSTPPYARPMMTMIADTLAGQDFPDGIKPHDLLFCRCDSRHYEINFGDAGLPNCQNNLADAIAVHNLSEADVHDPLNLFMTTGMNEDGRPYYLPAVSQKGDYVEFVAEIDCLVAISACPGGSSGSVSHGLEISVFKEA
jgi:uncharacterized protein YcgI (DUF1989 family)